LSVFNKNGYYLKTGIVLVFIFIIFLPKITRTQQDSISNLHRFKKKYIVSYWHDTKKIAAEPFHWRAKQWSIFASVLGVSVITYIYDKEIYDFFQRNRTETTDAISKYAISPWGNGIYSLPLLAGIYLTGIKDNRHRNVALTGLKAFLLSGGAAQVTKYIFHRHRPGDNDPPNPYLWEGPFEFTTDYTSFPSGHTATAFAVASVLAYGYKDKIWVGVTSYTVASLVGLSRINDGKHWATDVIAGAALGTFIGTVLSKINFESNSRFAIKPNVTNGSYGLIINYKMN
jgi:membrane-associated phospholipid phosphatase